MAKWLVQSFVKSFNTCSPNQVLPTCLGPALRCTKALSLGTRAQPGTWPRCDIKWYSINVYWKSKWSSTIVFYVPFLLPNYPRPFLAHIKSKQKKEIRDREKRECAETGAPVVKKERTPRKSWGVCLKCVDLGKSTVKLLQTQWNQSKISNLALKHFYFVDHKSCLGPAETRWNLFWGLQAMVLRWWGGNNLCRPGDTYIMKFRRPKTHTSCVGNKVLRATLHQISMLWRLHCKKNIEELNLENLKLWGSWTPKFCRNILLVGAPIS